MKTTTTHVYFWKGYMSNWFKSPFVYEGITYNNGEQYMMHQKALLCGDITTAKKIMETERPDEQKFLGRCIQNYDEAAWSANRESIVFKGLCQKFLQNPKLHHLLKSTGDKVLVEASPYDCIRGVGLEEEDPLILDEANWKGQNLLGKVLMKVRAAVC
jgi:ribA/ribD-fused uncharacterized protein